MLRCGSIGAGFLRHIHGLKVLKILIWDLGRKGEGLPVSTPTRSTSGSFSRGFPVWASGKKWRSRIISLRIQKWITTPLLLLHLLPTKVRWGAWYKMSLL